MAQGPAVEAISAPVTLTVARGDFVVSPALIARTLAFVPQGGALVPKVDGAAVHEALAKDLAPAEKPAVDATFEISKGRPEVVPSRDGEGVDDAEIARALAAAALPEPGGAREGELTLSPQPASLTTKEASGLGVTG